MAKKITTIEGLAAMIQNTMASKEDIVQLSQRLDGRIDGLVSVIKDMREEMNETRKDVSYIRSTINTLVSNDATQDAAIINLAERVEILEEGAILTST